MSLEAGTKLGPYEILSPISTGNGGDVYKASDTRLNRAVGIRVLPPEFSDPETRQRLESHAQTLAALNHPHICSLYDVGEHDGANYLVTEHVEGETLAQRLTQGPLGLGEALNVAIAIADALDKAHRRGVTHRGLNPTSVMLTSSGIKLMDFGLTKSGSASAEIVPLSALSTRTSAKPLAGIPAFAAPYVAPEQWEGAAGDARTDIFALGAILHEMIAGTPAFDGKTQALVIAAIQTVDPDPVSRREPTAPPALDYVIKRCLAKEPKQRLQTAWDLLTQLQWIAEGGSQVGIPALVATRYQKRERLIWIALASAAVLVLAMAPATYRYLVGSPEREHVRFMVSNLGSVAAAGPPPSISPDGRWIIRSLGAGNPGVTAVLLGSVTPQILIRDSIPIQPFWSPDSRSVAFLEGGKLKTADIAGGPSKIICDVQIPFSGGTWGRDGVILFSSMGQIYRVLAAGGEPMAISTPDAALKEAEHLAPFFLPDSRHYLYFSVGSQPSENAIYVGDIDSKDKKTRLLASESRAYYAAPGFVVFNREGTVYAQPFDPDKLTLSGEPVRIADGVPLVPGGPLTGTSPNLSRSASYAVSQTGVLVHRVGGATTGALPTAAAPVADRTLTWFDRSGARTGQVGGPGAYAGIDLTPDGKKVAAHVHDSTGGDSWYFDSSQGRMQRLTFDARQDNSSPIWSPDGTQIAFASRRNGKWGLYVKAADGTAKEELITESDELKMPMSWSPDGKLLVYWVDSPQTRGNIWYVPVSGDKKPVAFLATPANERFPQLSPDGKWIAYTSDETSRAEIHIKPFPEGPGHWQISLEGGGFPRWRADSQELFYASGLNVMAVDIKVVGTSIQAGVPHSLFGVPTGPYPNLGKDFLVYAVSGDGKRFLIPQLGGAPITPTGAGSLADQIAETADEGSSPGVSLNSVVVVLNWPNLLKRK